MFQCCLYAPTPGSWLDTMLPREAAIVGRPLTGHRVELWHDADSGDGLSTFAVRLHGAIGRMRRLEGVNHLTLGAGQVQQWGIYQIDDLGQHAIGVSNVDVLNGWMSGTLKELGMGTVDSDIQLFRYSTPLGDWEWNVTKAIKLARARMSANGEGDYVVLEREELQSIAERMAVDEARVESANPEDYGLAVIISEPNGQDQMHNRLILIDGNHRAVKALRLGRDYRAILLTQQEHESVVMVKPAECEAGGVS